MNGPVIVGAGPSGLAVGAGHKTQGVPFIILERANCIASLWQNNTYDRLKLHLPKRFCQLPNFPFPEDFPEYPTKRQFIAYLESYAKQFFQRTWLTVSGCCWQISHPASTFTRLLQRLSLVGKQFEQALHRKVRTFGGTLSRQIFPQVVPWRWALECSA